MTEASSFCQIVLLAKGHFASVEFLFSFKGSGKIILLATSLRQDQRKMVIHSRERESEKGKSLVFHVRSRKRSWTMSKIKVNILATSAIEK